jgi:hypothetical protein
MEGLMMEFTRIEAKVLTERGYRPGYIKDIAEGDIVVIPPVSRRNFDGEYRGVKYVVVDRLELDSVPDHSVYNFIGLDLDMLPVYCSYGAMYNCMIKSDFN